LDLIKINIDEFLDKKSLTNIQKENIDFLESDGFLFYPQKSQTKNS